MVRVEKSDSRLFRQADRFPKLRLRLFAPGDVPISLPAPETLFEKIEQLCGFVLGRALMK